MRKPKGIQLPVYAMIAVLTACGGSGGTVQFTASGEVLSLGGYAFPPANMGDPAFVDGWEIEFDELLVTIDKVTLSENPDKAPTDQSQTDKKVAELSGPWAFDLHKGGDLMGKGGSGEQAVAFATLANQNLNGNAPFDPTVRYAFGYDIVPATMGSKNINMDAAGMADYATMVASGWTVFYKGTATFKGTSCTSTNAQYDFTKLPAVVKFSFGFKSPTTYLNCQNPDNDPARPLGKDEHQRGLQIKNGTTIAQVTIHSDHPFWESFVHDTPPHFDQLAAQAKKIGNAEVVTLDSEKGVNFTAFTDTAGNALPWRACLAGYRPPNTAMSMNFDSQGIPYDPKGDPTKAMRDYYDFMTYDQSTQGHLNSNGLCFVQRNYPSPQ